MTRAVTPSIPAQTGSSAPRCPYVGLVPFDEADAAFFFGRRREVKLLAANLGASRLTLLYAPSGVGKTSVLRAGLLPYLDELAADIDDDVDEERRGPLAVYIRDWSGSPVAAVISAVTAALEARNGPEVEQLRELRQAPTVDDVWLAEVLRMADARGLYLILDQFEEYLLYHPEEADGRSLIATLGNALRRRNLRVNVLIAIREDALAQLDRLKGTVPYLFDNYLRLSHLARREAREAVTAPLEQYNHSAPRDAHVEIEPALVENVLDEVQVGRLSVEETDTGETTEGDAGGPRRPDVETPFLQLVLVRLWSEERLAGSLVLRAETLRRLGGARTIVQGHLDTVLGGLDEEKQDLAALVLRHLVTSGGSKIALGVEDLAELTGAEPNEIDDLVRTLSRGPRSILRPLPPVAPGGGPTLYEIFHDVLGTAILAWRRRRLAELERRRVETALADERREAQLVVDRARRRLRRVRLVALALAVVLIIVTGLGVFAFRQWRDAQANQHLAEAASDPDGGLRHAVAAYHNRAGQDTRAAVLRAASVPEGRIVAGPETRAQTLLWQPGDRQSVVGAGGDIVSLGPDGARVGGVQVAGMTGQEYTSDTAANGDDVAVIDTAGRAHLVSVSGRHPQIELGSFPPSSSIQYLQGSSSGRVMVASQDGDVVLAPATGVGPRVRIHGPFVTATRTDDGEHVVTAGRDNVLRAWDANGALVASTTPLPGFVQYLAPFRDRVVAMTSDTTNKIVNWDWRINAAPAIYPLKYSQGRLNSFRVDDASGTVTFAAGRGVQAYRADAVDDAPTTTSYQPVDLFDARVSPDGRWIATAGGDGRVLVWARSSSYLEAPTFTFTGHRGRVTGVLWDGDSRGLSSVGVDGTARRWMLPDGQRFSGHTSSITDVDVSGDGNWVATASDDGTVALSPVDRFAGPAAARLLPPLASELMVRFDPRHPERVFTVDRQSWEPQVWTWTPGAPAPVPRSLDTAEGSTLFNAMAVSPEGDEVAVADTNGFVYVWNVSSGHLIEGSPLRVADRDESRGSPATSIAFDPRGELLAVTGGHEISLWRRAQNGALSSQPRLNMPNAASVTFDSGGRYIVASSSDGHVQAWQRDGRPWGSGPMIVDDMQGEPAVSADGRYVATGSTSGVVEVRDLASGELVGTARQHGSAVTGTRFVGADDARLVSVGSDNTAALWACAACRDPDAFLQQVVASQPDG